ncbi:MAG: nucleoside-diphosphate sugar epimerase/dehydratase [Pseudomonadales bacterium]|nr:nucleoside-diphosphate sugar epimerase/dehydratase [Pseudomonadales bacterium]
MQEDTQLSNQQKRYVMMMADALILVGTLWASVALRYGDIYKDVGAFWWLFPVAGVVGVAAFAKLGLYRAIVRYIGPSSMLPVIQGVTIATVVVSMVAFLSGEESFPRSAPMIFWFVSIMMIGGGRLMVRAYFYGLFNNYLQREPVAIYGAGESGAQLSITLLNGTEYMPVAFIDDDRSLRRNTIHGIRVYGADHIGRLVNEFGIGRILLAVPSATPEQRGRILNHLSELPIQISTVPDIRALIGGKASVAEVEEIDISDLLGRDMVPPDAALIRSSIEGKSILITGAGGTIGSELCRKILQFNPRRLVLFDNSELALYSIELELAANDSDTELDFLLGSVLNKDHLSMVMDDFSIQIVYHAAAYKHVSMVERNIIEGVRNNVLGTWCVAQAANENHTEKLVLISTDKAVRATSVMGASKRLAELIIQSFATQTADTQYCMVRFGNVLGSSGSILPLFKRQIEQGGPVTLTHKDASRFFMTSSEAAELVIQAGAMGVGGDLFVLDMGEPVRIQDFAERMIHLHGKNVKAPNDVEHKENSIEISYIGLYPGEKLHEELIIGENVTGTQHPKIMRAEEDYLDFETVKTMCARLQVACKGADYLTVKEILEQAIPAFTIHDEKIDPVLNIEQRKHDPDNVTPINKDI